MTRRRAGELAAVFIGLAVWGYLGWDLALWDPRLQLLLHLAGAGAVATVLLLALNGAQLPRTPLDVPILVLVAAFGVACLTPWNAGLSARALGAIIVTAALLPVALLVIRHRPQWTGLVVTLPILGLAAGTLVVLGARRVEWLLAGGPGLPPVRLGGEGTPFGAVTVPPFILMAALPVALLIKGRPRAWVVGALVAIAIPLTVLSGSRSAWIALGVAAVVLLVPGMGRIRPRLEASRRVVVTAGLGVLVLAAAALLVARRLTELSSLVYRVFLWRDTLLATRADPLFGIGPGSMPWARQAAAPDLSLPVRQPHSHDLLLGLFGDAGVIGLVAGLALFVTFVRIAGPWRTRTIAGRLSFAVLMGFAAAGIFEDLTFLPDYNLLVLLLVAVTLADAGAVRWRPLTIPRPLRAAGGLAGAALLAVMLVGDAAAIAYGMGVDAAASGDWSTGRTWLERSVVLDRWHPAGPKALAVVAAADGRPAEARGAAELAVARNPGDAESWTNLALLCHAAGDAACARSAATMAVAHAASGEALVNAAAVEAASGETTLARQAYGLAVAVDVRAGLAVRLPAGVDLDAAASELVEPPPELNLLVGRAVLGEAIVPNAYRAPIVRALAFAMLGDRARSDAELARAEQADPGSGLTWSLAALLAEHWTGDATHERAVYRVVAGATLPDPTPEAPPSARPDDPWRVRDIAAWRWYPADGLILDAMRLRLDVPWPWVLEPLLSPPGAGGG